MANDDLAGIFGLGTYNVLSVSRPSGPATFTANGMFDGAGDPNLVGAASSLLPGEVATIEVTVDISGVADGVYQNVATLMNTDTGGNNYVDNSVDGGDPDPGMNNDPTDDTSPTVFTVNRGLVRGTVYVDFNNNGVQDAGEPGIPAVEIHLAGVVLGVPFDLVTMTDLDGNYSFLGLAAGDYTLTQTQPAAFIDGQDVAGTQGGTVTNDRIAFSLAAGNTVASGYNFGEIGINPLYGGKDPFLASGGSSGGAPGIPGGEGESDSSPFVIEDRRLMVYGTPAADVFVIRAGLSEHIVEFDFVAYAFPTSEVDEVWLGGGGGEDQVTVYGSSADDEVLLRPGKGDVISDSYAVRLNNVEHIKVDGGGGINRVTLTGSSGDETLVGTPHAAELTGEGFSQEAVSARTIFVYGNGGVDRAYLHDSTGNDEFVATPEWGRLRGPGYQTVAFGFDRVQAFAEAGGYDTAALRDSSGNDRLIARPGHATLRSENSGFYNKASGFDRVNAYATVGNDVAHLYDGEGDDHFIGRPRNGVLRGENDAFYNKANAFDKVFAYADQGGNDTATFYDSGSNEHFVATPEFAVMRETSDLFQNYAAGFEVTQAYATGGDDRVVLRGSDGDDRFATRRDYTSMISRGGESNSLVAGFDATRIEAGAGDDMVYVREVGADGMLYGRNSMMHLSSQRRDVEIRQVENAMAFSHNNETANSDIRNVDYLFARFGNWS